MGDASDKVDFREWRIIRLGPDDQHWPFMELDVGECFVEGDLSRWGSLRTRASSLRKKFGDLGLDRSWSVRKEIHNGSAVLVVRRTE